MPNTGFGEGRSQSGELVTPNEAADKVLAGFFRVPPYLFRRALEEMMKDGKLTLETKNELEPYFIDAEEPQKASIPGIEPKTEGND